MSLEQKIMTELKAAMLAKDEAKLRGLRAVKAAIILAKTSEAGKELNEEEEMKILQKLVKQRKESIEIYTKQNREDLAVTEREEVQVIELFLPKMMSEEEVRIDIIKLIESVGAKSPADMGKVMGAATKHFAGKADNKIVSAMVKELLGS
jgi:uncharacterized protein YqeY